MKTSVESRYALKMAQAKFIKNLDREMLNVVVFQMELIMLLALHDKFGFGKKRCQRAIDEFESILESYSMTGITDLKIDDIAEVVRKEIKMGVSQEMLDIINLKKGLKI